MSKFSQQHNISEEKRIDKKENERSCRETLAKYYYDLSKLAFATTVLGGGSFSFFGDRPMEDRIANIIVGIHMTIIFAILGYRTINIKVK